MLKKLKLRHEHAKHIFTSISGAVLSQVILVIMMPILTHYYTPAEFGTFSLYVAIVAVCSVAATARYELAVMQPKQDMDAINIVGLCFVLSFITSILFLFVLYFFHNNILLWIGNLDISSWLYAVPLSIFLTGIFQTLTYWNNRKKQFSQVAFGKITQGSTTAAVQLIMGLKKNSSVGLILGNICGLFVVVAQLLKVTWHNDKLLCHNVSIQRMLYFLLKYKKFPMYSLWGALFDGAAVQMPILILSKFYDPNITGLFSLTFRALNLPMVLISASISSVIFQRITSIYNYAPQKLYPYIIKTFFILLCIFLPFLLVIFFFGADIFRMVFGEQWVAAGEYASILVFAIAMRFAVSPLSTVLVIEHNLRLGFYWQCTYFFTISLTLFSVAEFGIHLFIFAYVIHELILYLIYLYLILWGSKRYQIIN